MEDKYARGWLLTHYLLMGKKRPGQFDAYLRLMAKGVPSLEAGRQAFGDLRKLNSELDIYNREGKFMTFALPPSEARVAEPVIRQLGACEARIMPTRVRSAAGVTEKTAPELVPPARAVAAQCPNDAFVQRSLAEIEFDAKNNDQSMAAADRAIALDPGNVMAMLYKGRVLGRQGKWAEARRWFVKANRVNPDYALPLVLFYDSYMLAGQTSPKAAVDGLLRAIVLASQDVQLRQRLGYALIRQGDLKLARIVLAPVAFSAHSEKENPALTIVKQIDAGADAKAVLAEATKAKWNEIGKE
jgi:tetratricopeptide (TPR) repeat protein